MRVLITVMITVFLSITAALQAAPLPETARLLPPETLIYLDIQDTDDLWDKFQKTNYYHLYEDPAMEDFFKQANEKFRELIEEEDIGNFGELLLDDKMFPTGKVAAAVIMKKDTSIEDMDVNFIVMAQWNENFDKVRKSIEEDIKEQLEEGTHRKKENFRGADIVTVITEITSDDPEIEPHTETDYFCFLDDTALYSTDLDTIKFVVSRINKSNNATLWDDADFQAARKIVGPQYDMEFYINLKTIIKSAMAIETENPVMNPQKILTTLGLDQLTGIALGCEITANSKQSMQSKVMIHNPGQQRGLMKMFRLTSGPFNPPVFVSPETCRVGYFNVDFPQAGDELGRMLAAFSPMAAVIMSSPITAPDADGNPGVVLKTDILDNLGSQLIYAEELKDNAQGAEAFQTEQLFALEIKDKERIARSLSKIHSQFIATMKPDTQREFLGHTIYSIPIASFMPTMDTQTEPMADTQAQAAVTMPVFAFTVTDSHLIFGIESAIEQSLRRINNPDAKGLAQKPWHQYAKSTIPSSAQSAGFVNMILFGKQFWNQLKQGMNSGAIQLSLENDELGEFLPLLEALPEFEKIQKHFGLTVDWMQSRDDGFYYEARQLNWKEKEN